MHTQIQQAEDQQFKRLGRLLGTYWDEDSLDRLFAQDDEDRLRELEKEDDLPSWLGPKQKSRDIMLPLSIIIQPNLTEALKKGYSSKHGINAPNWAVEASKEGKLTDVFAWKPEEFVKFVHSVVVPVAPKA
jgi:hypothetical protein